MTELLSTVRFDQTLPTDVEPLLKQQYLRRGYYASVSYYDRCNIDPSLLFPLLLFFR